MPVPDKAALQAEQLHGRGKPPVPPDNPDFDRFVAERIVPAEHREPPCSRGEFVAWAVREAMNIAANEHADEMNSRLFAITSLPAGLKASATYCWPEGQLYLLSFFVTG